MSTSSTAACPAISPAVPAVSAPRNLRGKDFQQVMQIKVHGKRGRDRFSAMRLDALLAEHARALEAGNPGWFRADDVEVLHERIHAVREGNDMAALAVGLRWLFRGFSADDAAHIVNVRREVAENAIKAWAGRRW
jgi:hypothetical protein